jgi:hypothetical protein
MQTVQDYITASRILLQDTTPAPRYPDTDFQLALDIALDEAYRIRPDFFINLPPVSIVTQPLTFVPPIPRGYQSAFLYYITGQVQLRDAEEVTDARSGAMLNKFTSQLLTTPA